MPKVAIVTNQPTPYRKRQFSLITQILGKSLDIYYTDHSAPDRKWHVENESNYHFLRPLLRTKNIGNLNAGLISLIRNYDCIVIGGYDQPTYQLLALLCYLTGTPYIVILDGIAPSRLEKPRNGIASVIKRWIIGHSAACFANGTVSRQFVHDVLDLRDTPLVNQYLSVSRIAIESATEHRGILRQQFLQHYAVAETSRLILYSGRLIARKNIDDLIEALSSIPNALLVIAGHGPEEARLREQCDELNVRSIFLGHLEHTQLAEVYALSDCLVLPSVDEPWGLVVNEALLAGIPVVVSDDCGCAQDLVIDGKNGFIFPATDVSRLTSAIVQAIDLDPSEVRASAQKIMLEWSLENSAENFALMVKNHGFGNTCSKENFSLHGRS